MFRHASAFNQDISGWAVHSVTDMYGDVLHGASAFDQDLGWCVDDDVTCLRVRRGPCASASCGVLAAARQLRRRPRRQSRPPAGSVPDVQEDGVADDAKMMTLVVLAGLLGLSLAAGLLFRAAPAAAYEEAESPTHVYGHCRGTESPTHVYGHGRPSRVGRSRANSINAKARSVASWLLVCLGVAF